jgi:hypothetical protein
MFGGGLNGGHTLNPTTVFRDGFRDTLTGGSGVDWFFAGSLDVITDWAPGEQIVPL